MKIAALTNYETLLSGVVDVLAPLPADVTSSFESGDRGVAAHELAKWLILSHVEGLDVSREINTAQESLVSAFNGHAPKGAEKKYGWNDINAIQDYINGALGKMPEADAKTYTIEAIRQEARTRHYPSLEDKGLVFSEKHPKPYRSDLILPALLERIDGLDTGEMLQKAAMQLRSGYVGVPKKDGTAVDNVEATLITKTAVEKTESAIARLLGPKIERH